MGNPVRPQSWLVVCDLVPELLGVGEAFFLCPSPGSSLLFGRSQRLRKYERLTLLLQKERDLNTAARIGQSLVKQNSALMEENNKLETMLGSAREEVFGHLREKGRGQCVPFPKLAPVICLRTHPPVASLSSPRFCISGSR